MNPRIITTQLILFTEPVGSGTTEDPKRSVLCVGLPDGQLLCRYDPHAGESYVASLGVKALGDIRS